MYEKMKPTCVKCGLEMTRENSRIRAELFFHDVCLPKEFQRTVVKQPQISDILTALMDERGAIVSSADCSEMELAFARKEGRFYVDKDGFGFVLRTKEWLADAHGALLYVHQE